MVTNKQQTKTSWINFSQDIDSSSVRETEESIVLRILVQTLVIIGIIATDVAAETQTSLWAIPLSIAGATWSWFHRKKRNITMKFILAIAMLGVLFYFLDNLVVNLNDSRLALAKLLIQLQILHSFDLPRRKDLGYSMVIGLILLGVAGTIAQTLAFAPWLLLFLAVALPTLILDYRSRLGLERIEKIQFWQVSKSPFLASSNNRFSWLKYSPLSPHRLAGFLAIIVVLGLSIFLLMPRLPGYQLQTFPMSGPEELANKTFDEETRDIVNPGYIKPGKTGGIGGGGTSPEKGAGKVDETFYYGFFSKMNQNLRGTMKPELVMRVRSQAPGFWRVLSFDHYTGQGWEISRNEQLFNLQTSLFRYRFSVDMPAIFARTKQVIQSYTIVSTLSNILPALTHPQYVYFPVREMGIDPEGSLRVPVVLTEGLTYTVVSQVPYRNRTELRQAAQNYPKTIEKYYLPIPPKIAEKVRARAEELLAKSEKPLTSPYEKALFLAQALKQNYAIIPDLPFFEDDQDLVEEFLFTYQGGYPDHFSTVLTVMLRSLGIPARLTVGFAPGQFNPFTGYYLVKNTDAYALTEVYFPGYGWFAFDPIPGHELIPPSFEEEETFSVLKQFWNWVAGWLPSPIVEIFTRLWNGLLGILFNLLAKIWEFVSGSVIGVFVGLITAIGLGFLGWLGWNQLLIWNYRRRLGKLPPMEKLYQQMLWLLKKKGYEKHPAQTPLEYAYLARQYHPDEQANIIEEISQAYVSWRYGEYPPNLTYHRQQFKVLQKMLNKFNSSGLTQ